MLNRTAPTVTFFYMLLGILLSGCVSRSPVKPLMFDLSPAKNAPLHRWNESQDEYLVKLRSDYDLDHLVAGQQSTIDTIRTVCYWVHNRWRHGLDSPPPNNNPIEILRQAARGKRFSCLEYSFVTAGCLNSLGITARVVELLPANLEYHTAQGVHVVVEAYISSLDKWVYVDTQCDAIPLLKGTPLNAVQFQRTIAEQSSDLELLSRSGEGKNYYTKEEKKKYIQWIAPYLFYFRTLIDHRCDGSVLTDRDSTSLLLVPYGWMPPKSYAGTPFTNMISTSILKWFYFRPNRHQNKTFSPMPGFLADTAEAAGK